MKILFVGSYPPPYGGVTTHIKRLTNLLFNVGYNITILDVVNGDFKKINKNICIIPLRLKYIKLIVQSFSTANIVHIHTSGYGKYWRESLLIILSKISNNKVVITIHGGLFPEYVSKCSAVSIFCLKFWLKYSNKIIFVSCLQKNAVKKYILSKEINKFEIIPAYLPEEKGDMTNNDLKNSFVEPDKNYFNVLVMGNWLELYGLDIFIYAVKKLIDNGINLKANILIYIYSEPDLSYKMKIESLIESLNLRENVTFIPETDDTSSVYRVTDIFVRPTHTDGDAMSVREAISFGIPVIASDVCERPEGVVLFKNKDPADLAQKLQHVLDNFNFFKIHVSDSEPRAYGEKLVQIYSNLF
ncbi:glycosyltransferase family 4 protein [Methanosarcina lacustris]|uniref:glycosyltransferase family 4 protein n=1 Tax=Methanosarcina lacustris TaxID=170861 RepID=UPI00064E453D|nr:glycosyltransferase family 4 protein [Methanosarcina lacustris]